MSTRRKTLLLELSATFLGVVIVAFSVNVFLTIRAGKGPLEALVEENLTFRARTTMEEVSDHLEDRVARIRAWAAFELLSDILVQDRALRIENLLLGLQRVHSGDYERLEVIDRKGIVVASTEVPRIGSVVRIDELPLRAVGEEGLRVGRASLPLRGDVPGLVLAQPIVTRLSADSIGWLLAELSWRPIERIVVGARIRGRAQSPRGLLVLTNEEGRILAGRYPEIGGAPLEASVRSLAAKRGFGSVELGTAGRFLTAVAAGTEGEDSLTRGLRLVALWSQDEAHRTVRFFTMAALGSAALGLLLAAGASSLVAHRIVGRVRRLMEGTERLAGGNLSYRVREDRNDELGHLARSFNRMAERLNQAVEEVEAGSARWRGLVENAPDTILIVSRDGTIQFINRTLPGFDREDVVGSEVYSYMSERYARSMREALDRVFRTGEAGGIEIEADGPQGAPAWFAIRIGPIHKDGEVASATMIATDITGRKRLERQILEVSESERERVGQDLHDGLGQMLTGASLLAKGLQKKLQRRSLDEASDAMQINEVLREAILQTRVLARGLFPIGIKSGGLRGALEELAGSVATVPGVTCRVRGQAERTPRGAAATHLFRIAQEAVSNALRHGKAKRIEIRFRREGERDGLTVTDDGVGFPQNLPQGDGMGLDLMNYRATILGGTLEIQAGTKGGTVVTCWYS